MDKYGWLLIAIAVVAAGSGCGKAEQKPAAPEPVAVDASALPEFLRYPNAVATERIDVSTTDSRGIVWTLLTADPGTTVSDWYRASAEQAGWKKSPEMHAGQSQLLEWENPEKTETVKLMLYPKDGKTAISITHGLK